MSADAIQAATVADATPEGLEAVLAAAAAEAPAIAVASPPTAQGG